ncbi:penicillin-binding protein 1C [Helicobacter sp. 23-1044]
MKTLQNLKILTKLATFFHPKTHPFRFAIFCATMLIFAYSAILFFSFNPQGDPFNARYSKATFDRNGEILSVFLSESQQWHIKTTEPLGEKLTRAILAFEDKRFYSHLGFDLSALVRSFWHNLTHKNRSGASTITMQTIKLLRGDSRTYFNKFRELIFALKLEWLYNKDEILSMYANNAPYGGNIVGVKTAALYYFGKSPQSLSWGQAALLAVLPNAPGFMHLQKNTARLLQKRDNLLKKLNAQGFIDDDNLKLALSEGLPKIRREKNIAPHLSLRLANGDLSANRGVNHLQDSPKMISPNNASPNIRTTIDKTMQIRLESTLKNYHQKLKNLGIQNVAAIIVGTQSREVLAYGGSQDFFDIDGFGQIDGIIAKRSVGSVLKPLLYALSIDNGLIVPQSKLVDAPTLWANFKPQNANKKFYGFIPAQNALIRSLNVPFVALLQDYGYERFFYNLQNILGFSGNNFEQYGLSLILGTKEFSVEDIAKIYVGLGNYGRFADLKYMFGGNLSLESCNSFSGNHSADLANRHKARTQSPLSLCRFTKNYESTTAIPSVVDSANAESNKKIADSAYHTKNAESDTKNDSAEVSLDNFVGFQARNCEIELEVHRAVECAESSESAKETNALLSQGASFLTLQAMSKLDRLGIENYYKNQKIFSWKSGTSYGRKDAWAAGTSPKYTIVVWAGNFDGSANPNLFGVNIAGDLLFSILGDLGDLGGAFAEPNDALKNIKIDEITGYAWDSRYKGIKSREVPYPKNARPLRKSPFLKNVFVDKNGNEVDSQSGDFIGAHEITRLNLPINLLDFYKEQNLGLDFIAKNPRFKRNLKILYPKNGIKITPTKDFDGENALLARIANLNNSNVFWYVDREFIGSGAQKVRALSVDSGNHTLTIINDKGESDSVIFSVEQNLR